MGESTTAFLDSRKPVAKAAPPGGDASCEPMEVNPPSAASHDEVMKNA